MPSITQETVRRVLKKTDVKFRGKESCPKIT